MSLPIVSFLNFIFLNNQNSNSKFSQNCLNTPFFAIPHLRRHILHLARVMFAYRTSSSKISIYNFNKNKIMVGEGVKNYLLLPKF